MEPETDTDDIDNYFYGEPKQPNQSNPLPPQSNQPDPDPDPEIIVGIDLGTTNSCIAIWRRKNLEIIPDAYGNRTIPSVVAFTSRTRYIGLEAKKQIEINTQNTFYEIKRVMGRKIDDPTVIADKEFLTYNFTADPDNSILLQTNLLHTKNTYTPEELSSFILTELKIMAENYLKTPVTKAVITVPAYFNDAQRQATKDAATIAGLDCVRIINEPTAAALAYGLEKAAKNKDNNQDTNVIVYDIGGGTTDVSLLNIADGMFQVLASSGNTHLGGADFDNRLARHSLNEFKKKHKYDNLDNVNLISIQKLKQACENAKKRLSETNKTVIIVKDFHDNHTLSVQITREQFEMICRDLFILCLKPVDDVLKSCDMKPADIDEIILVGGCSRMPTIRSNLKLMFEGREPNVSINPDEVVAAGAAIQAYIIANREDPFSENIVLLDIIPLSLGVEVIGGLMDTLIPRNSVIPVRKKKKYTTDSDYVDSVNIKIYEGERKMTKDNLFVGDFTLAGIEAAPRGIPQIEVSFCVDINGIISVQALDLKNTDNNKTINVNSNKGRLSDERIAELVNESLKYEIKDKEERKRKQLFYEIEDLCSNIKLNINNPDFKLKENDKTMVIDDIDKIFDWLKEMAYSDRSETELCDVLKRIRNKYGILILKVTNEMANVKSTNTANMTEATGVANDDSDDETNNNINYEQIEHDQVDQVDPDIIQETRKEIRRLREMLITLANVILDIVTNETIKIDPDHIVELKEYVDDILLWVYVKEKITVSEYRQKIDEVNDTCNMIVDKYQDDIFNCASETGSETGPNVAVSKRDELEQLAYTLWSSIVSNMIILKEDQMEMLKQKIQYVFGWLDSTQADIASENCNDKENRIIDDATYQEQIDALNSMCNELYNQMLNIHIRTDKSVIDGDIGVNTDDNIAIESYGTDIRSLRK